jgi:hypothetical protein
MQTAIVGDVQVAEEQAAMAARTPWASLVGWRRRASTG